MGAMRDADGGGMPHGRGADGDLCKVGYGFIFEYLIMISRSRSVGGRAASPSGVAGGRAFRNTEKTENKRGRGGPPPPLGVENTCKGAKEGGLDAGGGAGNQHQVRAGRMALRVGFEQGFPGFRSVLVSAYVPT